MRATQHLFVSLLAVGISGLFLKWTFSPALFAASVLGSLFPDVDHERTKLFRFFLVATACAAFFMVFESRKDPILSGIVSLATVGALFLLKPRHRGITHSFFAPFVFGLAVYFVTSQLQAGFAGAIAYGAHLLADRYF